MIFSAIFSRTQGTAWKVILKVGSLFLFFHCLLVGAAWFEKIIIAPKTNGLMLIILSVFDLPIAALIFSFFSDFSNSISILITYALGGGAQWFLIGCLIGKLGLFALRKSRLHRIAVFLGIGLLLLHTLAFSIIYIIDNNSIQGAGFAAFGLGSFILIFSVLDYPATLLMDLLGMDLNIILLVVLGGLQWFLIGWGLGWIGIKLTRKFSRDSTDKEMGNSAKTSESL